uniref:Uncharacterized protein n=1 Tax=Myotis myotis TaxID=51298 RepID=A0A7J8ALD3_MYOMY|nr:hypothetical protein mMyoMyo1_007807 [Myotis myotis]
MEVGGPHRHRPSSPPSLQPAELRVCPAPTCFPGTAGRAGRAPWCPAKAKVAEGSARLPVAAPTQAAPPACGVASRSHPGNRLQDTAGLPQGTCPCLLPPGLPSLGHPGYRRGPRPCPAGSAPPSLRGGGHFKPGRVGGSGSHNQVCVREREGPLRSRLGGAGGSGATRVGGGLAAQHLPAPIVAVWGARLCPAAQLTP